MNRLLLVLSFICISTACISQGTGFLFLKKGHLKKRTYTEGDRIMMQTNDGLILNGIITLLRNDTVFVNGRPIPRTSIAAILLAKKRNRFPADGKTMLLITGGAALTTAGLTLNNRLSFKDAAITAGVIGFVPLIIKYLGRGFLLSLQRGKYRIGKKYRIQILDFHLPNKRGF